MPYEYLDHTADVGIRGIGSTLEEAFSEGALAMLATMADVGAVQSAQNWPIRCTAPDLAFLFVEWLNEILYQQQVNDVLLNRASVTHVKQNQAGWALKGTVWGEPFDPQRHETYAEVKGATLSGLDYRYEQGRHIVQCVLDV